MKTLPAQSRSWARKPLYLSSAGVCVHLDCYSKNTTDWVDCNQQRRISHGSGSWESKVKALVDSVSDESPLPGS